MLKEKKKKKGKKQWKTGFKWEKVLRLCLWKIAICKREKRICNIAKSADKRLQSAIKIERIEGILWQNILLMSSIWILSKIDALLAPRKEKSRKTDKILKEFWTTVLHEQNQLKKGQLYKN